jgi:hypothetical protein
MKDEDRHNFVHVARMLDVGQGATPACGDGGLRFDCDSGSGKSNMDPKTFTLIVWLVGVQGDQLLETEGLREVDCHVRAMQVRPWQGRAFCMSDRKLWAPGRLDYPPPECVNAGCGLLPGRKPA